MANAQTNTNKANWESCNSAMITNLKYLVVNCNNSDLKNRASIKNCITKFDDMTSGMTSEFNCSINTFTNDLPPIISLEILKGIRGKYTKENFLEHLEGNNCGYFAKEDFNNLLKICNGGNIYEREIAKNCLNQIAFAQKEFSQVNCMIPINDYQSYLYSTEWVERYKLKAKKTL